MSKMEMLKAIGGLARTIHKVNDHIKYLEDMVLTQPVITDPLEWNTDTYRLRFKEFTALVGMNIKAIDSYRMALTALERDGGMEADLLEQEITALLRQRTAKELNDLKKVLMVRDDQYHRTPQ